MILDAVERHMIEMDWRFHKIPEDDVIICNVKGDEAAYRIIFRS